MEVNNSILLSHLTETDQTEPDESISIIALYFSASWCGNCANFTKKLIEFYNQVNSPKKVIEVFFASSDTDEEEYKEYSSLMPWKSLPYNCSIISDLESKFSVCGIPRLVILTTDGKVIKNNGRKDVCFFGNAALEKWRNPLNDKINELWEEILKGKEVNFPNHMHPLVYTPTAEKVEIDYERWECNECGNYFDDDKSSLYCSECNYDCCEDCFKMNMS